MAVKKFYKIGPNENSGIILTNSGSTKSDIFTATLNEAKKSF
jgi:hypothetical protein